MGQGSRCAGGCDTSFRALNSSKQPRLILSGKKSVRLRVNRRLRRDAQVLGFPPSLAPIAKACSKKATRSGPARVLGRMGLLPLRRGAGVQDASALHPGAHRAQAGRQQRLLFQVEPTAGQSVLCGEHKDPQFVGAPPLPRIASRRGCGRRSSARPDGTRSLQERSATRSSGASVHARLSGALSVKAGPRAPTLSPPLPGRGAGRWRDSPAA